MTEGNPTVEHHIRLADVGDGAQLVRLWAALFDDIGAAGEESWSTHAREWFSRFVDDAGIARFPVIEAGGRIVATAIGTLELGVPNPHCPRGRTVRLANVFTVAEHRGHGYGTALVRDVVSWAQLINADRVDLSATAHGRRIYDRAGFVATSAPRMKLVLR